MSGKEVIARIRELRSRGLNDQEIHDQVRIELLAEERMEQQQT